MASQGQPETKMANAPAILLIVVVPMFFGVLNGSAVAVILPDIAADLSADTGQLSWLMTGFLLVYGIAIPFYGRLGDLYGARRLFLFGIALFSVGSLLSAIAPNFWFLLAARIVQAGGGAAVPSLGMAIASRAYGPESRGTVLGVLAATIGAGGAAGPLLGGALADSFGWESIFVTNAVVALIIPFGLKFLPPDEDSTGGKLDWLGGAALALLVTGVLLFPSEGARSGWTSPLALAGAAMAVVGLVVLSARQLIADSPFIPAEFLRNSRYVGLVGMSFLIMAANMAALIGLPILLATLHGLSALGVGLVLLPSAAASSVFGVLAGRLTDRRGARLPTWMGLPLMLLAVLGLSTYAGSSVWIIAAFAGFLGGGLGLVNTPLAATVSRIVPGRLLASALSVNSMFFFLGGSLGTAVFMAVVTARADSASLLNPFHSGVGGGFSDAFLILAVPLLVTMALSAAVPSAAKQVVGERPVEARPVADQLQLQVANRWVDNCSVPWTPECLEVKERTTVGAASGSQIAYETSRPG